MEPKKITQAEYLWGWYVFEVVLYVHVFPASSITFVAKNFFYTDFVSGVSDILSRRTEHRRSLAIFDNYPLTRKNARFDIIILHRHLWGGRFQMAVTGERQVSGGNGRNPSGQEGWIWSE